MASIITNTLKMMYELKAAHSKIQSFEMGLDVSRELMKMTTVDHKDDGGYVTELAGLPVKVDPGLRKDVVKIIFISPDGIELSKAVVNVGTEPSNN